jgi:hypothetical protein
LKALLGNLRSGNEAFSSDQPRENSVAAETFGQGLQRRSHTADRPRFNCIQSLREFKILYRLAVGEHDFSTSAVIPYKFKAETRLNVI